MLSKNWGVARPARDIFFWTALTESSSVYIEQIKFLYTEESVFQDYFFCQRGGLMCGGAENVFASLIFEKGQVYNYVFWFCNKTIHTFKITFVVFFNMNRTTYTYYINK